MLLFLGGLLGGPIGMAIGSTIGGVGAYQMSKGKYQCTFQALQHKK